MIRALSWLDLGCPVPRAGSDPSRIEALPWVDAPITRPGSPPPAARVGETQLPFGSHPVQAIPEAPGQAAPQPLSAGLGGGRCSAPAPPLSASGPLRCHGDGAVARATASRGLSHPSPAVAEPRGWVGWGGSGDPRPGEGHLRGGTQTAPLGLRLETGGERWKFSPWASASPHCV